MLRNRATTAYKIVSTEDPADKKTKTVHSTKTPWQKAKHDCFIALIVFVCLFAFALLLVLLFAIYWPTAPWNLDLWISGRKLPTNPVMRYWNATPDPTWTFISDPAYTGCYYTLTNDQLLAMSELQIIQSLDLCPLYTIRLLSTHNSYKRNHNIHGGFTLFSFFNWMFGLGIEALNEDHSPLYDQLRNGVLCLELDVNIVGDVVFSFHIPGDYGTENIQLRTLLYVIRDYMVEYPNSLPIIILFDMKCLPGRPTCMHDSHIRMLQAEYNLVFPPNRVITPSHLINVTTSMRAVDPSITDPAMRIIYTLSRDGWPTIGSLRGRVLGLVWLYEVSDACEKLTFSIPISQRALFIAYTYQTSFVTQVGTNTNFTTPADNMNASGRVQYMTRMDVSGVTEAYDYPSCSFVSVHGPDPQITNPKALTLFRSRIPYFWNQSAFRNYTTQTSANGPGANPPSVNSDAMFSALLNWHTFGGFISYNGSGQIEYSYLCSNGVQQC